MRSRKVVYFTLLILIIFLLASCSSILDSNPTVYITDTGSKYHRDGCRYLSKSKIAISLDEAKSQGYTPCSVCKPPQ
ncbi:MAG: competence protein ComEC [Planctomycetota bacterium]|nr:competence protein ComEC [Planctomycetota bacterium]